MLREDDKLELSGRVMREADKIEEENELISFSSAFDFDWDKIINNSNQGRGCVESERRCILFILFLSQGLERGRARMRGHTLDVALKRVKHRVFLMTSQTARTTISDELFANGAVESVDQEIHISQQTVADDLD